jgi:hypothetical protein
MFVWTSEICFYKFDTRITIMAAQKVETGTIYFHSIYSCPTHMDVIFLPLYFSIWNLNILLLNNIT